ncbi:MAG: carbohydrate porin [Deltaproteobacteria bacterium]|nr:carbohydrate porin [Deltaproteobacteria bacterium]
MTVFVSTRAFAEEPTDADAQQPAEEPQEATKAEQPLPVAPAPTGAAPAAAVPAIAALPPATKPKVGDLSVHGYFRGGWGASNQKGRMTCFGLSISGGLKSKYRLGNECEQWGELHITTVAYVGEDGTVASLHFMPTAYIPTTEMGYSPTAVTNSPAEYTTATGATVAFPNLYADIQGIPWLFGGTAWVGTRYYKRESFYISDFFYWNPSGVGGGIEDFSLGQVWESAPAMLSDLRFSYGLFAVDGQPKPNDASSPPFPMKFDLGIRNDLQVRGFRPYEGGELQIGFQYIHNWTHKDDASGNTNTHSGWGVTVQHVQDLLGGNNKLAFQYGKGGGTGFGTLARFYYPDFSLYWGESESRMRLVDVLTIQPTGWLGAQAGVVWQRDDMGTGVSGAKTDWYSAGARLSFAATEHLKLLAEAGYDRIKKDNGSDPSYLAKFTIAPAIAAARGFWARPELRLFLTMAMWNDNAAISGVDSGNIYRDTYPNYRNGYIAGLQAEAMW